MLQDALNYLKCGFSVIPCTREKKPLLPWEDYQKRLPQDWELQEWWRTWPDANIGIVTGRVSSLVVVDVDGEKGLGTVKRLGLPKGPTVKTGKGYHRYFAHPSNGDVRNFQVRDGLPGIDLRGDGGYVVAPPSIHKNGTQYKWLIPLDGTSLPPLPESLLAVTPTDKTPVADLLKGVPEGQRNNALASIAGILFGKGLDYGNALQLCLAWNRYNNPPLEEREVEATVESIYKTHLRKHPAQDHEKGKNSIPAPIELGLQESNFWKPTPIGQLGDIPPIAWLWEGYLARGRITELVGLWKSGKTTLVAHLLREMALEGELAGKKVSRGKVLIISEEDPGEWKDRKEEYNLPGDIDLICLPFLAKPNWEKWQNFITHINGLVPSYNLVVIDSIANLWPILDENNNAEIVKTLLPLRQWTKQGVSVLIIHHPRKGDAQEGQASRGGGSLPGFVDVLLEFRRYDPAREDNRRVITGYSRRKETPREVVIELMAEGYELLGTKSETREAERLETLKSLLPVNSPGVTGEEIKEDWPSEPRPGIRTIKADLETLHRKERIERTGEGKKGDPYRYWLKNSIPASSTPIVQESNFDPSEVGELDLKEVAL